MFLFMFETLVAVTRLYFSPQQCCFAGASLNHFPSDKHPRSGEHLRVSFEHVSALIQQSEGQNCFPLCPRHVPERSMWLVYSTAAACQTVALMLLSPFGALRSLRMRSYRFFCIATIVAAARAAGPRLRSLLNHTLALFHSILPLFPSMI